MLIKPRVKNVLLSVVMISFLAIGLYRFSKPVLFRITEGEETYTETDFTVFNPFRNRAPEHYADAFLNSIRENRCDQAMATLPLEQEYKQYLCEKEKRYPLRNWQLKNRKDEGDIITMFYWGWRENYGDFHGRMWITVEKRGGDLNITSYSSIY